MGSVALTPAAVSAELARRDKCVTERRLADWRELGLMPALVDKGRGQGGGKQYFWDDQAVIDRAALIHDILEVDTQTDTAFINIWLLGYDVDLERIRHKWIDRLSQMEASAENKISKFDFRDDGTSALGSSISAYIARQLGTNRREVAPLASEMTTLAFGGDEEFDYDYLEELLSQFARDHFKRKGWAISVVPRVAKGLRLLTHYNSPRYIQRVITCCSDVDLICARNMWVQILEFIVGEFPELFNCVGSGGDLSTRTVVGIAFGRLVIPMLTDAIHNGYGGPIKATIDAIVRHGDTRQLNSFLFGLISGTPRSQQLNKIKPVVREVLKAWAGVELQWQFRPSEDCAQQ